MVFTETLRVVANSMKMAAYLFGHLDGCDLDADISARSETISNSGFAPSFADLHESLRRAWDERLGWNGFDGLSGVIDVLLDALFARGLLLSLDDEGTTVKVF
jgi:hypothetical protein